jgi:hypothetical protein
MQIGQDRAEPREVGAMEACPVDLGGGEDTNADPGRTRGDGLEQLLAVRGCDLLRVVECCQRPNAVAPESGVVEEHTRDDERAGERSPACLVRAGDETYAESPVVREETLAARTSHAADDRRRRGR